MRYAAYRARVYALGCVARALISAGGTVQEAIQSRLRGAVASREGGLPGRYAFRVVGSILFEATLMLLLIEGIFLAEKFGGVLETAFAAKMSAWQIALFLLYTAPEVFGLALPAALLIAIYRVVLRLREDRELLVMASAGIGLTPLLLLVMAIAVPATILSLLMSGFVGPHTQFMQRKTIFQSTYETLRSGSAFGEFHFPNNYTAFVQPPTADLKPRLFLHQMLKEDTDRLVIAKRWGLAEEQDGWFKLQLQEFTSSDFFSANGINSLLDLPLGAKSNIQMSMMAIGNFEHELSIDHLVHFSPRGDFSSERTWPELIAQANFIDLTRGVTRGLLCLLVPLIALLGVVWTHNASRIAIPPLMATVVMGIDIAAVLIVRKLAPSDLTFIAVGIGVAGIAIVALLGHQLVARQNALLKPALDGE